MAGEAIGVLEDNEKFTATAQFTDIAGAVVGAFPAPPVWASADPGTVGIVPSADGMTCEIDGLIPTGNDANGNPITIAVSVTATNDDGSVLTLTGFVQVVPSEAVAGGLVFGAAEKRT